MQKFKELTEEMDIFPILGAGNNFDNPPGHIPLGEDSPHINAVATMTQPELNDYVLAQHKAQGITWSLSGDRENRVALYEKCDPPQDSARSIHIGVDVNAPAGTKLHAPIAMTIHKVDYEGGLGGYGWYVITRAELRGVEFFFLFGHLAEDGLPNVGDELEKGQVFALIGDFHENGMWFHHVHVQVLTRESIEAGWALEALCEPHEMEKFDIWSPSAMPIINWTGKGEV